MILRSNLLIKSGVEIMALILYWVIMKWISDLADTYGVLISPHGPSGPVSVAASVQAMLGTHNFLILEFAFGEVEWREQLSMGTERTIDGHIPAPELPGLGIELDRKVIDEHAINVS